jgi:hypothetical protein
MLHYRVCAPDAGGTISIGRKFSCDGDPAALLHAAKMMNGQAPAEIWEGARFVGLSYSSTPTDDAVSKADAPSQAPPCR